MPPSSGPTCTAEHGRVSTILVYLALVGAAVSWIAGAVFFARPRAGAGAAARSSLAASRSAASAAPAASRPRNVNKALVAFIACLLVGVAAFSASTNLHRFAK